MKKIALTGSDSRARIVLTRALAYIIGYEIAGKTDYAVQAIQYGLNEALTACKWSELFVYLLSSFSERIVIEQHYDQYISNGSVLYELAVVKALHKAQTASKRKLNEQAVMLVGAEKIITAYAKRQYDGFVYIETELAKEDVFTCAVDNCIKELLTAQESVYRIRKDSILSDMLEKISTGMKIQPVVSAKTALDKAQEDILE